MTDIAPRDYVRRPPTVAHGLGTAAVGSTVRAKLKGHCPDGERCRFQQSPCVEQCSRLQPTEITAELQANARACANRSPSARKAEPDIPPDTSPGIQAKEDQMNEQADEPPPPPVPVIDYPCKIRGCTNRARSKMGRYANLCDEHRDQAGKKPAKPTRPRANGHLSPDAMVKLARDLLTASHQADELKRQLEQKLAEVGRIGARLAKAAAK